jgi:hypothetical protein
VRGCLPTLVALIALAGLVCATDVDTALALTADRPSANAEANAGRSQAGTPAVSDASPSGPPLSSGDGAGTAPSGEAAAGEAPQAETDPLVSNGLGSPTCDGALAGELSATSRRNCETSGFGAAPAPTGDYGIDVHINTGVLGLSDGGLLSAVQGLAITPLWMALVWAVHALVVMLEWCFTVDALGAAATGVGRGLRQMQASFTDPWLPIALAIASVLALYHGLIRRRVAETLGEALLMIAMMVGGMWVIADPTGTVGALGDWTNQASLGTLAVAASGTPAGAGRALGASLDAVFDAGIEAPWCYLEFGDVGWCREPARLDHALRAAGLRIAAEETAELECPAAISALAPCVSAGGAEAKALQHSIELLREARSNGAIFLALPANGAPRNSINEQGSLLRVLCESDEATSCRGPTAAQAEFRTDGGTWPRFGGLLLIAAGLLGMLLLLGFLAVRLLVAAISSLLLLLLAPAMVLVPAFGEAGRALFRRWAAQLLGAVVSKLVFSFLLGVLLAVVTILSELQALGWWTQWLLMSAVWWSAYTRRHQALAIAVRGGASEHWQRRSIVRRMSEVFETPRAGIALARRAKDRRAREAPEGVRKARARIAGELARAGAHEQSSRVLEVEHRDASTHAAAASAIQRRLAEKRAQLTRLGDERASARAAGDSRRAAELGHRRDRVQAEIEREDAALSSAQRVVRDGEQAHRRTGALHTPERRDAQDRFLDAQAALPSSSQAAGKGERRDYIALSALAGYGREEYRRLDPRRQREARLEIDRELALRRELGQTATTLAARHESARVGRRERRRVDREFAGALERRMREKGRELPASRRPGSRLDAWIEAGRAERRGDGAPPDGSSSVMHDAREVAARRKRQLGRDRP